MNGTMSQAYLGSKYVVAMYIRLSVEDSKTDSLSITNQRQQLRRYIDTLEQNDVEVLEFIDNGYSGTNFERPAVQELLELVRRSRIDCIIVKDFSRFGRNSIEMGYFIEMVFPVHNTRFISVGDGFDTNNYKEGTGGMEVAFKYLMHEYYSKDLSNKTKSSKYSKMRRGEYQSKVCLYGYKKGQTGRLEIDPDAAEVVKLIFSLALNAKNAGFIVRELFERKILPPGEYRQAKGIGFHDISRSIGIWNRSSVLRILTDERYTGTYIIGKRSVTEVGGKRSRMKPESEWIKIPNHHPAIVERAVYELVQGKLLHVKCDKHEREYTLRTKVFCGCCKHAMSRLSYKLPVFACKYTKIDVSAECHGLEICEHELENLLFEIISKQAKIILNIDDVSSVKVLELRVAELADYDKRIKELNDRKRDFYEQFVTKEIDESQFKSLKSDIDIELIKLVRTRSNLASQVNKLILSDEAQSKSKAIANKVTEEANLTKALVDALIEKVYVYPNNQIEILWKVNGFAID